MLILLTCVSLCIRSLDAVIYDCFSGTPANESQIRYYEERNNLETCTINIDPCDPEEWKRVDGSCNNLKFPSRGTHRTPTLRLLPPEFSPNYEPRKAEDGNDLPLSRHLRWELLHSGRANELRITQLATYYVLFYLGDVNSLHDIFNYIRNITDCCTPRGRQDYRCTSIPVPRDDPVHRFSGVSCFNLTRPVSFQSYNCTENGTIFTRMVFATPVLDLSQTYNSNSGFNERLRTYRNGLMKMERDNGILFPPTDPNSDYCKLNERPRETRCNMYHSNPSAGSNMLNILFYRFHNHIAKILRRLNPCWDDDRLFYTARDINIAVSIKIYLYDLLPIFLGKKNMIREGLISCSEGFRNLYDESVPPQVFDEYAYIHRWFHTAQETKLKFYDRDGFFVRTFPIVNLTTRTGFLPYNMEYITQGSFRQLGAKFDHSVDVDMGEKVLGEIQAASDVKTSDLDKGRLFGFAPYIKFREFCTRRPIRSFGDLKDDISPERLKRVQEEYQHPNDIDLLAGAWVERRVKGGKVPRTVYCLIVEQLKRIIRADRHWFELEDRPHAFDLDQLKAVHRTTIAGVLCAVGDTVTEVQPNAFYIMAEENPLTKCSSSKIGNLDLFPWKDPQCSK